MSKCKITGKKLVIQLGRTDTQILAMNGSEILHGKTYTTPAGAVEDGMIRNQDAIRELLKGAMKEPEFKGIRQAVFTLCTSQVITETVATPDLPAARLEKLLMANVDMYFPVDMHDYQLVWQVIGPKHNDSGAKEVNVQLWAMPVNMVNRYYQVANACGLSVAAIDFIGHSIAGAIGASFAQNTKGGKGKKKLDLNAEISFGKKKAEPEPAAEDAQPKTNPATQLHLLLDKDILGMTFVQNGQVMVQRFVRCGSDPTYQFGELAMMLEYFRAMDIGRGSAIEGIVSGALAEDRYVVQELEDIMGISLSKFIASYDLSWFLCVGAACTALDFGIPSLNKPGTARREIQSQLWQYGLLLAGGLAVLFVVLTLLTSRLTWDSEISSLTNTQQMLTIQNSKVAGYADNYYDYESKYNAYSNDWDTVFASLQTYNDNLVLVMEELEEVMPEKVNVVNMQIGATGLNVAFACDTKEEAAYLITALDQMEYAELIRPVSDLLGGGAGPAESYGTGTTREAAPVEGSSEIAEIYVWNEQAFLDMAKSMTPAQLTDLEVYAQKELSASSSMSEVQSNVNWEDRKAALKELFTGNPFATNRMLNLVKKDAQAESADTILVTGGVMFELYPYRNVLTSGLPADPVEAEATIDGIIGVLAKDETRLQNTEALLATDDFVSASYILHVDGENTALYYLDTNTLYQDAKKGEFKTTNTEVTAQLETLLADVPKEPEPTVPDETTPGDTTPDETTPDETTPDVTEPQETYEASKEALKKLLANETVGDVMLAGRIREYITTGQITDGAEEAAALDAYVQSGAVDAQLENWLTLSNGNEDYETNATVETMLSNYREGKGNTVLNSRIKAVEEEQKPDETKPDETKPDETKPDETKPNETKPDETKPGETKPDETKPEGTDPTEESKSPEEQMKEKVVTEFLEYWENGPKEDDPIDAMFEDYMKTGKFDLSGTGFEDMVPEGMEEEIDSYMGQAVSLALYNYLTRGLEEGKYYSELMNKYFTFSGNSGYPHFDDTTDKLIESGTVNTLLARLIVTYRKAGKTGHDVMDGLFKKYEDKSINSTGIWPLDKALKQIYFELLTASTQQAAQQASAGIARDNHIYFSVYLNYKEELANVERDRKGLDYEKKIEKLEVGE